MQDSLTPGAAASKAWLERRGFDAERTPHWYVEITIPSDSVDTWVELNIYPEEWGVVFRRGARVSSLRVTDVPFVHGLDDYRLLSELPALEQIDDLLVTVESRYELVFQRPKATVKSNLVRAAAIVRPWLIAHR